jgi:uncharacterized membrane protein YkvA (DUF1232 family)
MLGMYMAPGRTHAQPPPPTPFQARDAVLHGLAYFGDPTLQLDMDAALLHTYIRDRFGLPGLCQTSGILSMIRSDRANPLFKLLPIATPIAFDPYFLSPAGQTDDITICGVWYDQLRDKRLLEERIKASDMVTKPYLATHALWAMSMAKHCFQAKLDTALERRLVQLNMDIITERRPRWNDVAIEALAMVQYHDPTYVPPRGWIQEIASLQNPNGSWNLEVGEASWESQHTTVLALWALLQYKPLAWPEKPRNMVLR